MHFVTPNECGKVNLWCGEAKFFRASRDYFSPHQINIVFFTTAIRGVKIQTNSPIITLLLNVLSEGGGGGGTGSEFVVGFSLPNNAHCLSPNPAKRMQNNVGLGVTNFRLTYDPLPVTDSAWEKKIYAWAWAYPIFYMYRRHW